MFAVAEFTISWSKRWYFALSCPSCPLSQQDHHPQSQAYHHSSLIHITIVPSLIQPFFPHSYRHCIPIRTTFFHIALPVEQLRSFATEVTRVARDVGTARREDSAGRPTKVGSAVHHTSHANGGAIPAGVLSTQQPSTTVRETKGKYAFADFNIQRTLGTGSFGRELGAIGRSMPLIPASHFEPMVCINGTL